MAVVNRRPGVTLIETLLCVAIAGVAMSLALCAVQAARRAAVKLRCQNNLAQMGRGLHHFHDANGALPEANQTVGNALPYLSWQARLLPFVELDAMWASVVAAYAEDKAFWSPPHRNIRAAVIDLYVCPADGRRSADDASTHGPVAFTHYLGVSGTGSKKGVLGPDVRVPFAAVTDGLSQTLMVGERPPSANHRFGWWYAGIGQNYGGTLDSHMSVPEYNHSFYAPTCPAGPYAFQSGHTDDMCHTFHFWSRHAGGAHFLFADASVRFVPYSAHVILAALASYAGGETVDMP